MLLRLISAFSAGLAVIFYVHLDMAVWMLPVLFLGFGLLCLLAALTLGLLGHLAVDHVGHHLQVVLLGLLDVTEELLQLRVVGLLGVLAVLVHAELFLVLQVLQEGRFFLRPIHVHHLGG